MHRNEGDLLARSLSMRGRRLEEVMVGKTTEIP